jgi:hypothetical protein
VTVPEDAAPTDERPVYTIPVSLPETPPNPSEEEKLTASTSVKVARWMGTGLWYISILAALLCIWNWIDPGAHPFFDSRYLNLPYYMAYERGGVMLGETGISVWGHSMTVFEITEGISTRNAVTNAVWVALFLVSAWQLKGVTRSFAAGMPFQQANVKRLRILAAMVMIWSPLIAILDFFHAIHFERLADWLPTKYTGSELHLHPEAIIAGVIILAVAQVFAVGAKLQREQDLTV